MRSDLWGSREGILLPVFGFRILQRFCVDGDNFENARRLDADILSGEKHVVSKISASVWTGLMMLRLKP